MRALILHGPDDLRLEHVDDPAPGPGEIILRVERALTCATDAKIMRAGRHPALPPVPSPLGHEVTGEVVAVGSGVARPSCGDRVVVANSAPCGTCRPCTRNRPALCEDLIYLWGAFADYVRVPARIVAVNTILRPDGLPADHAPMIEPLACALNAVARSGAAAGDEVVILGGGVQGQFLTAALAGRGCRVTVCDPHGDRRERALRFGAVAVADAPRDEAACDALRADLAGGRGADVVFEAVGRPQTWQAAVRLAGRGGEVNLYGGCPMGSQVTFPTEPLHYGELRLQGSYHHTPAAIRAALDLLVAGTMPVHELVGDPVGLEQVAGVLATSGVKRPVVPDGRFTPE